MSGTPQYESKIYCLNWKELQERAEAINNSRIYDKIAALARYIGIRAGSGNLIEWTADELLEARLYDQVVMYHVKNTVWKWKVMMEDMKMISSICSEIIFMITFISGDTEEKAFLYRGRFTTVLIDPESDNLILCY